jgi:predicted secreted hydrolase
VNIQCSEALALQTPYREYRMHRISPFLIFILIVSCTPKYIIDHSKPVRPLKLPEDDAAHYTAQTEWWYYTGHLEADDGTRYGFEVTFFKRLTSEDRAPAWLFSVPGHWIKEVGMLGHFAVTDLEQNKFKAAEINNIAKKWKADPDRFHVMINGWSAEAKDGVHLLRASMSGYSAELALTPAKPAALNGPNGILEKGVNANYYYSYTNMKVEGVLTVRGVKKTVRGKAWMDHEFGPMGLFKSQVGWDWFSIQMDNNTELMLYLVKDNGSVLAQSGGTYVDTAGRTRWLRLADIDIKAINTWTSPKTGAAYPAEWTVTVRPLNLRLHITPVMAAQELTLNPVTYWEGAVSVEGRAGGKPITGRGYVELVGYDKKSSFNNIR